MRLALALTETASLLARELERMAKGGPMDAPPPPPPPPLPHTRQCERRVAFEAALQLISQRYGGEPRYRRRAMARELSKRRWREKQA